LQSYPEAIREDAAIPPSRQSSPPLPHCGHIFGAALRFDGIFDKPVAKKSTPR
jgi:hypothetical protein